jgi:hypothetical protein
MKIDKNIFEKKIIKKFKNKNKIKKESKTVLINIVIYSVNSVG